MNLFYNMLILPMVSFKSPAHLILFFFPKMKCGNCGEISEKWQYIRLMVMVPTTYTHTLLGRNLWKLAFISLSFDHFGGRGDDFERAPM